MAILVQAIEHGKSVNVDLVIQHSILNAVKTNINVGFDHPMLITILRKKVGVVWTSGEGILQPQHIIDNSLLRRMKDDTEAGFSQGAR